MQLYERNPEAAEFVENYPELKNKKFKINLGKVKKLKEVPLYMQWDKRWGYTDYGGSPLGVSGCGPTCLSMVSVYLLGKEKYDPKYIAEFSKDNGYCVAGNGSSWTLMSLGGKQLGLDVEEVRLHKPTILGHLEAGRPMIFIMGPGDFTTGGHFIVVTGCEGDMLKVNDPNSKANSEKLWDYDDICSQIRNLWVFRKAKK